MPIRIVLVDDHAPFRRCLKELIEQQPGLSVVGQLDSGHSAVQHMHGLVAQDRADLLMILDIDMRDLSGLDAAGQILERQPEARILILSSHDDLFLVRAASAVGCRGYMLKDDPLPELIQAIRGVADGQTHISAVLTESLRHPACESPHSTD